MDCQTYTFGRSIRLKTKNIGEEKIMVFKNGELLRTYYYTVVLNEEDELTFLFSEFVDKNGTPPDYTGANNNLMGGGEIYEFKEMDIYFSDTVNTRTLQFYKRPAFRIADHEIFIQTNNNEYTHYDKTDFRTSIDRNVVTPAGEATPLNEDWVFLLYPDGQGDVLTGTLSITMVVRVQ